MNRRDLIAAGVASFMAGSAQAARLPIKKAVLGSMLPKALPDWKSKFAVGKDAGFTHIEMGTVEDPKEEAEIAKASADTGLKIHGVMNAAHWKYPLNSSNSSVVEESMKGMRTSLRNAKAWGASTVLLVPGVVSATEPYGEAMTRSAKQIKILLPEYEKAKVIIAVENVWNKFLLSPLEMASYVDQFRSPYLWNYLDVGNIVLTGYPQDWIRTMGKKRIAKVHIKDFRFKNRVAEFVDLWDGEIDWKAVHQAFTDIGYDGVATVELRGGDAAYLADVSKRFDRILEGA
ncbi:sugar phosphate isomerase/epimerase family protein [Bryobacter aggregatus]|uniref:sugar phosphate isomerase/epimerase family protein n=1 Tax=Bryobacter aggregatus TaxID=360054 RepID=UPI000A7AD5DD|nr:sugar phosphate isomerase/epimerase family protein [Bryobacter aggregatus]